MKQRVLALLCALLMLPALAACGEAKPAESEAPPTEQATPEPTPDDSELIVIEPEQTPLPVVTPAPTPIPVMAPIEPEEIPEGLDAFLNRFNYGYTDRMGGKEYDSKNCVDVRANILAQLVTSASCVDFSLYPGRAPVFHWNDGTIDPQNMAGEGGSYGEFDPAQIEWIAENILHISEKDYRAVLSRCTVRAPSTWIRTTRGRSAFTSPCRPSASRIRWCVRSPSNPTASATSWSTTI